MPPFRWIMKLGQEYCSLRREATMPTTPWCQCSLASTRALRSLAGRRLIWSTASAQISCSTLWRSRLSWQSSLASSSARCGSAHSRSSAARSASPMRPAALIRGERAKPTWTEESGLSESPASRSSAWSPAKSVWGRASSPQETMVRFSPSISITSAMVPMAARVQYRAKRASSRLSPPRAKTSFKATPTPARCLKGYGQSGRWGFTTATAFGSCSRHSWWSVTTTSMPRDAA